VSTPLEPVRLGERLAEVYLVVGPLYRRVLRRVELDQPVMGMSVGVRAVLEQLDREGPATVPQVARTQDLSRQFVQRMVNDALTEGWAEAVANPAHRKSSLIRLTAAGHEAIRHVVEREHDLMSRVGGSLTEEDVDTTLRVLREMLAALTLPEDDEPTNQG
jgi:DNA-binding MarR family transcriptional regulator